MSDHDHPLPPPEPDDLPLLNIVGWGLGSFIATVAIIVALGSYFWLERAAEDVDKVMGYNSMEAQLREAGAEEARRLTQIEQAMQALAAKKEIE